MPDWQIWLGASVISYAVFMAMLYLTPSKDKWPRVFQWYWRLLIVPGLAIVGLALTSPVWLFAVRHPRDFFYRLAIVIGNWGIFVIPAFVTLVSFPSRARSPTSARPASAYWLSAGTWVAAVIVAPILHRAGLDMHGGAGVLLWLAPLFGTMGLYSFLRERSPVVRMLAESGTVWEVRIGGAMLFIAYGLQMALLGGVFAASGFSVDGLLTALGDE